MPVDLVPELRGHEVETVSGLGWAGITNSELLRRAREQFDALVTMDQNLPFQQHLAAATLGVVLVRAPSNRLIDVRPLVPDILTALGDIQPGELRRIGAQQGNEAGGAADRR
jgi:hypothetical protein